MMRGVATPADRATSWKWAPSRSSASSTRENDRFTAQLPESVCNFHTSAWNPRACGPVNDSGRPNPNRWAIWSACPSSWAVVRIVVRSGTSSGIAQV